jgi:glycosyltransferase involved in cell wall biosynthesis
MSTLVTIGIPVYKRLSYLPHVLSVVAAQDYPNIDLLVSDNGMNGTAVPGIIREHYRRPYRFRQNPATVSGSVHYNQLIEKAEGEYVVILADDDEISPNFVSELVRLLEKHPEASAALAMEEVIDEDGNVMRTSRNTVPEILPGPEFIRGTWKRNEYGFEALCTFLAKTEDLRACGGFPDIWAATGDENLLMVKLCLESAVACSTRCSFRKRVDEASQGLSIKPQDLARGIREFITCLDSDPAIYRYSVKHPALWNEIRGYLVNNAWDTYYYRWAGMYKNRLPSSQWVAAAFALPLRPYGKAVASAVADTAIAATAAQVRRWSPRTYALYQRMKAKREAQL